MLCRLYLAVLRHNENENRTSHNLRRRGGVQHGQKERMHCKAFENRSNIRLRGGAVEEVIVDPSPVDQLKTSRSPSDLCSEFERPSKEDTVARHVSRFTREVVRSQHTDQPSLNLQHRTELQLGHVAPSCPSAG